MALLDRILRAITAAGLVLVLPISLLLFLQWPLRDLLQAYSREANDLAQWLFALYVSVAITYATRMRKPSQRSIRNPTRLATVSDPYAACC
jgi:TRAP-type C4-dicarboxylate transport system permease small subunit